MTERRRYTAKTRAKAVGIAMVEGVTAAERETGIPKQTIDYWMDKPEFGHLRTTARETVAEGMWVGIQIGVRELSAGLTGDAPLHHKAAAFQALADRYALLTGGATSRTESRELNDLPDSAYVLAIHEWKRLTEPSGESPDREAETEPAG
jgi:transposase-like protein